MAPNARVLVFQPVFTHGAGLDFRLLGVQFWIADRLTALGLEGASALMRGADDGGAPRITATTAPTDDDIAASLAAHEARYGLVTTFAIQGGRPQLAIAKLAELRDTGLHVLARSTFDHDAHLPAAALRLFVETAGRLGHALEPVGWELVFDTDDPIVAGNYLTGLGALSVVEQGFAFDEDSAEISLRALLSGVQVGMRPAVDLLPRLVAALHEHERAPIEMLRAAVATAQELLPLAPESWASMLRSVGVGGALVN